MVYCLRKSANRDPSLFFVTVVLFNFSAHTDFEFSIRMVIPWDSFRHLGKRYDDDYALNPEFIKLKTRLVENYGGEDS